MPPEVVSKIPSLGDPNDFIDKIISIAVDRKVSDIHITPLKEEVLIRFRIVGELVNFSKLDNSLFSQLVNVIKVNSGMDINDYKHAQDGKITSEIFTREKVKKTINLRVSTLPTIYGENVVMRVVSGDKSILDIEKLGFGERTLKVIREIPKINDGLILVSGGTGSGKTTTLYSILSNFDPFKKSVFTLEDPVEYQIDGYVQSEVKKSNTQDERAFTFADGLVGLLRQDPDIILIGELRRKDETIICFEAANTGHLVLGSIHTNNLISVITRLKQLGVQPFLIATGLKYIISQKILKKLCPNCLIKRDISNTPIGQKYSKILGKSKLEVSFINDKGCDNCTNGYIGSTIVAEVMKIDDDFSDLMFKTVSDVDFKKFLFSKGFVPYYVDAVEKSTMGIVDFNDAISIEY